MALKPRKFVWDNRGEQKVKDFIPMEFNDDGSVSKEEKTTYEEVFSAKKGTKDIREVSVCGLSHPSTRHTLLAG